MVEELGPGDDAVDWDAVRRDYEAGGDGLEAIAARHGVSVARIRYRRGRDLWGARRKAADGALLVARMLAILERQIRRMENRMNQDEANTEKEVTLLSNMARTLEKLLELDAHARSGRRGKAVPPIEDLREQLAKRLEDLRKP